MLNIQRISFDSSKLLQSFEYSSLIYPSSLKFLKDLSPNTYWIVVEVRFNDELIGLCLSEIYPLSRLGQIHSIVIKSNFRKRGYGQQLFAFTEKILENEEKLQIVEIIYDQTNPFSVALEKIISKLSWSLPKIFLIRCYFELANFNPNWLHYSYRLASSIELFKWQDLTIDERVYIEYLSDQGRFLSYISPFDHEGTIDLNISIGLRLDNKIIGWNIAHDLDHSTIRYSSLYIDRDFMNLGYGIYLLAQSINVQKELSIPYAQFEINVREISSSWWHFVKKRLLPKAYKIERMKQATRIFS